MRLMQFFNSRPGALGVVLAIVAVGAVPVRAAEEPPENWQLKFQTTGIVQYKPGFDARYSGTNSLVTNHEYSRSVTATLFGGVRLWKGGEFYVNPEMALGVPFSELKGLGGFNNGEMARTSGPDPTFYRARVFLRQTWGLGGGSEKVESEQNQLGRTVDAKRA